ncbi:hypothetical protein D9M72_385970 [compost metagenome]
MIGSDGKGITGSDLSADSGSGRGASSDGTSGDGPQGGVATVKAGDRKIKAKDAAAEEQPGSQNVTPGPEGGVK